MAIVLENETKLEEIHKLANGKVLEERREFASDLLPEGLGDIAFSRAIEEGEKSPTVSRSDVFELLEKTN